MNKQGSQPTPVIYSTLISSCKMYCVEGIKVLYWKQWNLLRGEMMEEI